MLIPPGYERLVIGCTIAYLPINLRHTIVYPTIIHPKQYICIKIIIILEAESFRTIRIGTLVAVDAEWRNTKLDPRLNGMNGFAELLYKPAHIITAPITDVSHAARLLAEELLIRNLTSGLWIWIEIIINMESINIISAYNVHCHLANIVGCSLQPRVQQRQLAILKTEIRTPLYDILRRNLLIGSYAMLGTIRINPGMKLHATIMTLLYHPLQRIPIRRRSLSLHPRKKLAPRL